MLLKSKTTKPKHPKFAPISANRKKNKTQHLLLLQSIKPPKIFLSHSTHKQNPRTPIRLSPTKALKNQPKSNPNIILTIKDDFCAI